MSPVDEGTEVVHSGVARRGVALREGLRMALSTSDLMPIHVDVVAEQDGTVGTIERGEASIRQLGWEIAPLAEGAADGTACVA